jgi:hypothetical protein
MIARAHGRHRLPVAVVLLAALALGGCSMPDEPAPTVQPPASIEAAKASLQQAIDSTIELLQPARFTIDIERTAVGPCDLPGGGEGRSALLPTWVADADGNQAQALTRRVTDHWRANGYQVKTVGQGHLASIVGTLPDGGSIAFGPPVTPHNKMTLDGETGCVPPQ